jgi:hypothetical protein
MSAIGLIDREIRHCPIARSGIAQSRDQVLPNREIARALPVVVVDDRN